ncbi:hypothetical protein J2853_003659 [Streptosporangium lutulentum]|uniref:Uncharacterized protein n=1 Tax=Streptosporangium lutulentum TaxID=1461250 RepID=A0ABT9QCE5_9ACTN|nr:hypothetical protein [Streptosporangium lutulentum]
MQAQKDGTGTLVDVVHPESGRRAVVRRKGPAPSNGVWQRDQVGDLWVRQKHDHSGSMAHGMRERGRGAASYEFAKLDRPAVQTEWRLTKFPGEPG